MISIVLLVQIMANAVGVCHNLNLMLRNAASKNLVELHLKASYLYIGGAAQLQERFQAASTWQGGAVSINPDAPSTRNS